MSYTCNDSQDYQHTWLICQCNKGETRNMSKHMVIYNNLMAHSMIQWTHIYWLSACVQMMGIYQVIIILTRLLKIKKLIKSAD